MLDLVNMLTFFWLTLWALYAVRLLWAGVRYSILFVFIFHFVFCGTPLILDTVFGKPLYIYHEGFQLATRDDMTCWIYCFYVAFCPVLWWWTGRSRRLKKSGAENSDSPLDYPNFLHRLRPLFYLFLFSPLLALAFAPEPRAYLNYAAVTRRVLSVPARHFHPIISFSCKMSLLGAAGLLISSRRRLYFWPLLFLLPGMALAVWLEGKRLIVIILLGLVLFVLWRKGFLKRKHFLPVTLLVLLAIGLYSLSYQAAIRPLSLGAGDRDAFYRNTRKDFGRDDVIKTAIYSELYPRRLRILENRGQSFLFYATMYVPRKLWPNKPWPYAVYMTSAVLGIPVEYIGWGVATSCLDEAIANFGWAGLLIGPLLISIVCRLGDSCNKEYIRLLTIMVAFLLLSVPMVSFAPIVLFWGFTVLLSNWHRNRRRHPIFRRGGAL